MKEAMIAALQEAGVKGAFVVQDLRDGMSIRHNEVAVVASASLIKLPIMAEVFRQVKRGLLSLKQRVRIKESEMVPFSIVSLLDSENSYTIMDLITLMIIQSDNTAANVLMDLAGMEKVNRFIERMGLASTRLQRKMMDAAARQAGRENLTTAADMAALMLMIYEGKAVDAESSRMMLEILKNQLDRGMLRLYLPDELVIAHKTGELEGINHSVGIVYGEAFRYLISILIWDAPDNTVARSTIGKISKIVFDAYQSGQQYSEKGDSACE